MTRPYTPRDLAVMAAAKEAQDAERWAEEIPSPAVPPPPDETETHPTEPEEPGISAVDEARPTNEEIHAAFERRGAPRGNSPTGQRAYDKGHLVDHSRTAARNSFISHP
jgi:hypothetical protein